MYQVIWNGAYVLGKCIFLKMKLIVRDGGSIVYRFHQSYLICLTEQNPGHQAACGTKERETGHQGRLV
jgi:hypothetical protein